jgi:glycosyltransferase involved in cell wall biosynthesis
MRAAGRQAIFVGACDIGTHYASSRATEMVMPHGEDEYVYFFPGMAEDRLAWDDSYQRRMLVDFLAGLDCDVYHLHHYWRIGIDLIDELMAARPEATFVITLHEMLAICLHHGQMIKTRSRELCRREAPLNCLACFPDQTLERFAFRKAALLSVLRRFDHVIYPSDFIRDRYQAWGLGARCSVLENYLGDQLMALPRVPGDAERLAPRFGFFGQPTAFKGLDVLLRAMALLPKATRRSAASPALAIYGAEKEDALRFFPDTRPICGRRHAGTVAAAAAAAHSYLAASRGLGGTGVVVSSKRAWATAPSASVPTWTPCPLRRPPACPTPAASWASCTPAATMVTPPCCWLRPSTSLNRGCFRAR